MNDDRVPYWIPLQWVAKRRYLDKSSVKQNEASLICRIYSKGSHFGYDYQHSQCEVSNISILFKNLTVNLTKNVYQLLFFVFCFVLN